MTTTTTPWTAPRAVDALFFLGLSLLLCHEMDAVLHAEWRVLPLLSLLPEAPAYITFVLLYVPIYVLLLLALTSTSATLRLRTQIGVSAFLVVHAVLHTAFHSHPEYRFHGVLSEPLIYGGGAVGALHLLLLHRCRRRAQSPEISA